MEGGQMADLRVVEESKPTPLEGLVEDYLANCRAPGPVPEDDPRQLRLRAEVDVPAVGDGGGDHRAGPDHEPRARPLHQPPPGERRQARTAEPALDRVVRGVGELVAAVAPGR